MCSHSLRDWQRRGIPHLDVGDAFGVFEQRPRWWARPATILRASGELCDIHFHDGCASVDEGTAASQPAMLAGSGRQFDELGGGPGTA